MSGSTGAERIRSRTDYQQFLKEYREFISACWGCVDLAPVGSYVSDPYKQDFGDMDLVVRFDYVNMSKKDAKTWLASFLTKNTESKLVPFTSEKYFGRLYLNTGEIVTVRFFSKVLGYSVQIDNIVSMSPKEYEFKQHFLNMPAEKQGLILGLVKVAAQKNLYQEMFAGTQFRTVLPLDFEYEFSLSSVELQLRIVEYHPNTFKEKDMTIVARIQDWGVVEEILFKYNLNMSFDELLEDVNQKVINQRSRNRIVGVFKSMISVKSGEVGTLKGVAKHEAIEKLCYLLGNTLS